MDKKFGYWERRDALEALYWKQWGRCYFCNVEMNWQFHSSNLNSATLEHLHPKSKGGTNDRVNLACSCLGCNWLKEDMTEAEFAEWIKSLCFVL